MNDIFGAIFLVLVGMLFGWIFAHNNVVTECEKLGSFYVGNNVYYCEQVNK